mgnify:CR=1 FL=1
MLEDETLVPCKLRGNLLLDLLQMIHIYLWKNVKKADSVPRDRRRENPQDVLWCDRGRI